MGARRAMTQAVKKVGDWHDAIIEFMLSHPQCEPREVAANFNVSQHWLEIIVGSDIFQERLRRTQNANGGAGEIVQPSATDKVRSLASLGTDILASRLERSRDQIGVLPNEEVCKVVKMALEALGHSGAPSGVFVDSRQVNTYIVDRDLLETARGKMRELKQEPPLELKPLPAPGAPALSD